MAPSLGGGNPFQKADDAAHATICSGVYQEKLPVAGMTVGQVREQFSSRLEISPEAVATISGKQVDDNTKISAHEVVIFIQQAGEKGVASYHDNN